MIEEVTLVRGGLHEVIIQVCSLKVLPYLSPARELAHFQIVTGSVLNLVRTLLSGKNHLFHEDPTCSTVDNFEILSQVFDPEKVDKFSKKNLAVDLSS